MLTYSSTKLDPIIFQAPVWVSVLLWTLPGDSLVPCPDALNKKPVKKKSQSNNKVKELACCSGALLSLYLPLWLFLCPCLDVLFIYLCHLYQIFSVFLFFHILSSFKNTISPASPFKFTTNPSSSDLHDVSLTIILSKVWTMCQTFLHPPEYLFIGLIQSHYSIKSCWLDFFNRSIKYM